MDIDLMILSLALMETDFMIVLFYLKLRLKTS